MLLRRRIWFLLPAIIAFMYCFSGCAQKHETDVEFVATPQQVVIEMLKMANVTKDDIVYDLGCGDGRIVITAAQMFGAGGVGVDIDPALIRLSNRNAGKAGVTDRVKFIEGDLFRTKLSKATVVSLYLTPELNVKLRPKFFRELKAGTRIVSHDFDMGDWKPDSIGRLRGVRYHYPDLTYVRDAVFYYWVVPADVSGMWRWTLPAAAGRRDYILSLAQRFQEISGQMGVGEKKYPLGEVRLTGERLSFTCSDPTDRETAAMRFDGRVHGDTIEGNLEISGGPSAGRYPWTAKRHF